MHARREVGKLPLALKGQRQFSITCYSMVMSLTVEPVAVGGYDYNFSYLIYDTGTKEALVVDPAGAITKAIKIVADKQLKVVGVLITHTHFDHVDGLTKLLALYDVPVYAYKDRVNEITGNNICDVDDGTIVKLGSGEIKVIYTPGHIDDAVCYFIASQSAADGVPKVITGDTLFVGGCGRTNEKRVKDLYDSLAELAALPPETVVYPGHDYGETPTSTIREEKALNKYYQVADFNAFRALRLGL